MNLNKCACICNKTTNSVSYLALTNQAGGGKYKTWTPGPWTPSVDRVHQNMDQVHGPRFMDRVHGPLIMDRVHRPPVHGPLVFTS